MREAVSIALEDDLKAALVVGWGGYAVQLKLSQDCGAPEEIVNTSAQDRGADTQTT